MVSMNRTASWLVLVGLAAIATLQNGGCDAPTTPSDVPSYSLVLADTRANVILPAVDELVDRTAALDAALSQWAASGDDADKSVAQVAFVDTMAQWQRLEAMQVGPALPEPEGADYADRLYSWPLTNPCRVDQETVEANWAESDFFSSNLVNVYGLDALEYLLYAPYENACPGQISINADGSWDALGEAGIDDNRSAYASAVASQIHRDATAFQAAWSDFSLAPPAYVDEQAVLNAVFDALFFLETGIKDQKLAEPLTLRNCTDDCLPLFESYALSGRSHLWMRANLEATLDVFQGGAGGGLDDILATAQRPDLTEDFEAALTLAIEEIRTIEQPLEVLAEGEPERLNALFEHTVTAADLLKGEIATVLSLEIPNEAAGDND